jgi:hypothetical protein
MWVHTVSQSTCYSHVTNFLRTLFQHTLNAFEEEERFHTRTKQQLKRLQELCYGAKWRAGTMAECEVRQLYVICAFPLELCRRLQMRRDRKGTLTGHGLWRAVGSVYLHKQKSALFCFSDPSLRGITAGVFSLLHPPRRKWLTSFQFRVGGTLVS